MQKYDYLNTLRHFINIRSGKMKKMQAKKTTFNMATLIIVIAICIFCIVFIRQQIDINKKNDEKKNLGTQIQDEKNYKSQLNETEKLYATDEYIEQIARDELNLVNPDEKVFIDTGSN